MKIIYYKNPAIILATICFIFFSTLSNAAMVKLSLNDLTNEADAVVMGIIVNKYSYWNPEHTTIYSDVTIKVDKVISGRAETFVTFQIIGGVVEGLVLRTSVDPEFKTGERAILFIDTKDTVTAVAGLFQGKYAIKNETVVWEGKKIKVNDFIKMIKAVSIDK